MKIDGPGRAEAAPGRPLREAEKRAFTIIELIAVMVVIATLAAVAVPGLASIASSRSAAAARQMLKDVGYARQRAVATGTRTWVVFEPSAERYSILTESPSVPGRANASPVNDPASGRAFVQQLGVDALATTGIVSASFDGAPEVGFDWIGRPLNAAQGPLGSVGTAVLTGGHTVAVTPTTGYVTLTP